MLSLESMEVRWIMIPPKHLNHDTIEDTDRRHNTFYYTSGAGRTQVIGGHSTQIERTRK